MEILICPNCQIRVAISDDSTCPSCRRHLKPLTSLNTSAGGNSSGSPDGSVNPLSAIGKSDDGKLINSSSETHFDLFRVCFSLKGRIPRSVYWFAVIGSVASFCFGAIATIAVLEKYPSITLLVLLLFAVMYCWSQVAISVKRFHDLGMSGYWFLIVLIPGIGLFVQFFLLGLQRGEPGENKYGRDPLELFE